MTASIRPTDTVTRPARTAAPTAWSVVVPLPIGAYDFAPPHGWAAPDGSAGAPLGCRVLVPWQGELRVGLVVGPGAAGAGGRLREAVAVLDEHPWVNAGFVQALSEQATLARQPLGLLWSDLLGVGWEAALDHRVRAVPGAELEMFGDMVPGPRWQDAAPFDAALLDAIRAQGLLDEAFRPRERTRGVYRAAERGHKDLTAKQQAAWATLRDLEQADSQLAWAEAAGVSLSVIGQVLARGWAELVQVPARLPVLPEPAGDDLNLPADTLPDAPVWRLHGGRPQDRYRRLGARILPLLQRGRGVVVVTPDHATLRRAWAGLSGLAARAGTRALCISGQLNPEAREHAWTLARAGEAGLVIGTAHALAAPLPEVALIVVDEEASDAHKLVAGSQAFVPHLAARQARGLGCPIAYTGAVPAAESVTLPGVVLPPPRARLHVLDYANPPERAELGPLSSAHLQPGDLGYPISHDLAKVLRQVAERGRQAVLLAPRRGYSALLACPSCDHAPQCRHCDVPLRFHQESRRLSCHQCGYTEALHERCMQCGEQMWRAKGPGTEWIAQEVGKLLPGFPVRRFDKDRQDDLGKLHAGEAGVVVGTQALLMQDALPNLALIGITLADTWLGVSDFRAGERYHRLLRQLIEWHPARAPLLLVQTFQAQHPALTSLTDGHDALAYPTLECSLREALHYPPHALMAQIEVAARDQARARGVADELARALLGRGAAEHELLGPAPAAVARLRGQYPYHLLLRVRSESRLIELLGVLDQPWKARVRVDVSPRGAL